MIDPDTKRIRKPDQIPVRPEIPPAHESLEGRVTIPEDIARGERAIFAGRILSHEDAKERMKRWLS